MQLHLFQSDEPAAGTHHFGIDVDDFEATYLKAKELDVGEETGYYANVYELPEGAVHMYVRDPARNLVKINYPDVAVLDRSIVSEIQEVVAPQTGEVANARLYRRTYEREG